VQNSSFFEEERMNVFMHLYYDQLAQLLPLLGTLKHCYLKKKHPHQKKIKPLSVFFLRHCAWGEYKKKEINGGQGENR